MTKPLMVSTPLIVAFFVSACAVTAPVVGQFTTAKDDFMGQATASLTEGTLSIQSQAGVTCTGTMTRPSTVSGSGRINCSDGRTGTFVFTKNNEYGGTGFGSLSDGEKFRFLWGNNVGSRARCDKDDTSVACSRY